MNLLVSGSLAYDYIMDFPDSFRNHILPDQIHILNVCFVVEELKKNFGGTAGNIAFTSNLLGGNPTILGILGKDASDYETWFKQNNLSTEHITVSKEKMTSSAHITTDKDDNQVTAFFPGAGDEAMNTHVSDVKEKPTIAIISPRKKEVMLQHAKECFEMDIPFCFDPGQQISALSPQEFMAAIGQATFLIGNDYEMKMIQDKTGWDAHELLNHVDVVITTLGSKGSIIKTKDEMIEVAPCSPQSVDDPTGAGDAYRAGFFTAYAKGHNLKTCGQVGSVAACYAIEHYGTQNHTFTLDEFTARYQKTYLEKLKM